MIAYSGMTSTEISSEVGGTATVGPAPRPSLMPVPPHTMGEEGETAVPTVLPTPFLGTLPARPLLMFYRAPGTVSVDPYYCSVNLDLFSFWTSWIIKKEFIRKMHHCNVCALELHDKKNVTMRKTFWDVILCLFPWTKLYVYFLFLDIWFKCVNTKIW